MAIRSPRAIGVQTAAASALFLGLTPIFGKLALVAGLPPLALVAMRTVGAAVLMLIVLLLMRPASLYIYPLGLVGCIVAGLLNGTGSLLYYLGLAGVDAALGHLLFSLYPVYVAALLLLDGYRFSRLTILRIGLSLAAATLLISPALGQVEPWPFVLMLAAGLLYALHIPINQRVLYEAPAPTVTFYTLVAMGAVAVPTALLFSPPAPAWTMPIVWPLAALIVVTFLSRLTLFSGVKAIGGLDTALIGLGELLITIGLAVAWLGERLSALQWLGAALLLLSMGLLYLDRRPRLGPPSSGWLRWLMPPRPATRPSSADPQPRQT